MTKPIEDVLRETFDRAATTAPLWADPASRVRTAATAARRGQVALAAASVLAVGLGVAALGFDGGRLDSAGTTVSPRPTTLAAGARFSLPPGKGASHVAVAGGYVFAAATGDGPWTALYRWRIGGPDRYDELTIGHRDVVDMVGYDGKLWVLERFQRDAGMLSMYRPEGGSVADGTWPVDLSPSRVAFAAGDAFVAGPDGVRVLDVDGDGDVRDVEVEGVPFSVAGTGSRLVIATRSDGATTITGIDFAERGGGFSDPGRSPLVSVELTGAGRVVEVTSTVTFVGDWQREKRARLMTSGVRRAATAGELVWLVSADRFVRYDADQAGDPVEATLDGPVIDVTAAGSTLWVAHPTAVVGYGGDPALPTAAPAGPVEHSPTPATSPAASPTAAPSPSETAAPSPSASSTPSPEPSPSPGASLEPAPQGVGMVVGKDYSYNLRTHCGIEFAWFDGRRWATEPLNDGNGNPPPGWDNPYESGIVRLRSATEAEFRRTNGEVLVFTPTAKVPPLCD